MGAARNASTTARRRRKRRATVAATARSVGQLLVVLLGGTVAGGLAVLAAFPDATEPVPPTGCLTAAAVVALATFWCARRLRPLL